tara:strand:- start:558 stop:659 length:102 start_codon:yes stop_codon:yes gene_type:complete
MRTRNQRKRKSKDIGLAAGAGKRMGVAMIWMTL